MRISNRADYALHAMLYIASVNGKHLCTIDEISQHEVMPREYLAKILKELTNKGLLVSTKGIHGGYRLAKPRDKYTFLEIIEAISGPLTLSYCNLGEVERGGSHKKGKCGAFTYFDDLKKRVRKDLGEISLGRIEYERFYPPDKR